MLDISMGGGAEIIVHGSEMDEMPAQNEIAILLNFLVVFVL